MKRQFRRIATKKIWKYKDAGIVYNDFDGIRYISALNNEIVLKAGFKPVKRRGRKYINIVKEKSK